MNNNKTKKGFKSGGIITPSQSEKPAQIKDGEYHFFPWLSSSWTRRSEYIKKEIKRLEKIKNSPLWKALND